MRPNSLPPDLHRPTPEEDEAINRGIALDPDNPEWSDEDFRSARPAREMMPPAIYEQLVAGWQRRAEGILHRAVLPS